MKDRFNFYSLKADNIKKTYAFEGDCNVTGTLNYTLQSKDGLLLTGKWKGKDVSVLLKLSPIDSLPLNKEKITLLYSEQD